MVSMTIEAIVAQLAQKDMAATTTALTFVSHVMKLAMFVKMKTKSTA